MADGKVSFAYSRFLSLDKDKKTGKIVVVPEQAKIVRHIFQLFLAGLTPHLIAEDLTKRGITTPGGKTRWHRSTIRNILTNEKYNSAKDVPHLQKCGTSFAELYSVADIRTEDFDDLS